MKEKLIYPILAGLILVIVTTGINYYYNRSVPDVRYTLSDPVLVSSLNPDGSPASVQQLDVKNLGTAKSEQIRIKISGPVTTYKVEPWAHNDQPSVSMDSSQFELVYPELPPQGTFKIIVQPSSFDVNASNLSVSDNSGPATAALSKSSSSVPISSWMAILFYSPLWIWYIVVILTNRREGDLRYLSVGELANKRRSSYIRKAKWSRIHRDALDYIIAHDSYSLVATSSSRAILCTKRPEPIQEGDWNQIIERASARFKQICTQDVAMCVRTQRLFELGGLIPDAMLTADRSTIQEAIDAHYLTFVQYSRNVETTVGVLKDGKPNIISDDGWKKVEDCLQAELFKNYEHVLFMASSPFDKIKDLNIEVLTADQQRTLKIDAYEKQFDKQRAISTAKEAEKFLATDKPEGFEQQRYEVIRSRAEKIISESKSGKATD